MGSEARSWADQWGAGGIGAIEYDEIDTRSQKDTNNNNKNSGAKVGFTKAKAVAVIDPDESGDNEWSKFERFRKEHLNKNYKFNWVVKKMQTSEIVRIRDIIQDIRQKFYVGISVARSWKAKLIAKKIIEGDVDKQFANLWRYVAKLTRINHRNTLKIIVERPFPSIQPRYVVVALTYRKPNPDDFVDDCYTREKKPKVDQAGVEPKQKNANVQTTIDVQTNVDMQANVQDHVDAS
ncbi:hypothetical protein KIW84_014890 [Lathyrus oleraceus]|uniref:Uncharacterized protein n=1 Tax=Pisum sativum TaxID=3888 RepID=A0A9D5BPL6_PEA|nr:hypothetical protein KIW84_014890 [Pisum sativum]